MPVQKYQYEEWLAEHSNSQAAILLLKQYRPYLEMVPSLRRPDESTIAVPLPLVRLRDPISQGGLSGLQISAGETLCLPCEIGILMCDPDWKIKTGVEIFIFVHQPHEDFSDLLRRWRQTQVLLDKGYDWILPYRYRHMISEGSDRIHPLFILFENTPDRIKRGLSGASLPVVIQPQVLEVEEEPEESFSIDDEMPTESRRSSE